MLIVSGLPSENELLIFAIQLRENELEKENAKLVQQVNELRDVVAKLTREKTSLHDVSTRDGPNMILRLR